MEEQNRWNPGVARELSSSEALEICEAFFFWLSELELRRRREGKDKSSGEKKAWIGASGKLKLRSFLWGFSLPLLGRIEILSRQIAFYCVEVLEAQNG